jgi:hypothetical protein
MALAQHMEEGMPVMTTFRCLVIPVLLAASSPAPGRDERQPPSPRETDLWMTRHGDLVEAIDARDRAGRRLDETSGAWSRRLRGAGKGAGIGLLVGAGLGAVLGFASGSDTCGASPDSEWAGAISCGIGFTAGQKAAMYGLGLGIVGAGAGAIVGATTTRSHIRILHSKRVSVDVRGAPRRSVSASLSIGF